ncbi:MCE family protein [Actinocorallia longicatena]|uniref:MlaD family protein n=1 Tax=Actinocorallia longicatena TaxID=111803 RepID=A0ABP6Q0X4_9ACTN
MALTEQARQRRATFLKLIAFFAVTGTLTFLIGTQIARVSFGGGYKITAVFDDANGLIDGDVLKIAGAPVGQVNSIKVKNGKAVVGLTVQDKYRVPADSEVAIRWRSAVGQRVVYLIPGTSTEKIRDGAVITRTHSVVDIGQLVDQLAPLAKSLNPEQLNQILMAIYQALDGNKANVTHLISNVDQLASTISARRTTLKQLLADYSTVTGVIARRDTQIRKVVDDIAELSGGFVNNRQLLDQAIVQLAKMFKTADKLIGKDGDQLVQVVAGLAVMTRGIDKNVGSIQDVLKLAGPKLQRLMSIMNGGNYVRGAVPCLTLIDGKCPYPVVLKSYSGNPQSGQTMKKMLTGGN